MVITCIRREWHSDSVRWPTSHRVRTIHSKWHDNSSSNSSSSSQHIYCNRRYCRTGDLQCSVMLCYALLCYVLLCSALLPHIKVSSLCVYVCVSLSLLSSVIIIIIIMIITHSPLSSCQWVDSLTGDVDQCRRILCPWCASMCGVPCKASSAWPQAITTTITTTCCRCCVGDASTEMLLHLVVALPVKISKCVNVLVNEGSPCSVVSANAMRRLLLLLILFWKYLLPQQIVTDERRWEKFVLWNLKFLFSFVVVTNMSASGAMSECSPISPRAYHY